MLSGNRNFEGRVNADVRANYLASPPLVVAYALAGSMQIDLAKEPLGTDQKGSKVFLKDIWPSSREISDFIRKNINKQMFTHKYADVFKGDAQLAQDQRPGRADLRVGPQVDLRAEPALFRRHDASGRSRSTDIVDARVLGLFLDSITTDHISPAGSIKATRPAGKYLVDHKVKPVDFNQYGTRRGNHEVMMRGTFANIRIKNQMVPGVEGGFTIHYPSASACRSTTPPCATSARSVPLVVFAGKEYGTGSSRDWAAKGTDPARRARGDRAVASSASIARTWSAWAWCRWCSRKAPPGRRSASRATRW